MDQVEPRKHVVEALYRHRAASRDDIGAVEVANLAKELGANVVQVAMVCRDLVLHGHVDAEHNMTGFVRLSDNGVAYYDEVKAMENGP